MTDGKLDALGRDPVFSALCPAALLRLGRLVDLVDLPALLSLAPGLLTVPTSPPASRVLQELR